MRQCVAQKNRVISPGPLKNVRPTPLRGRCLNYFPSFHSLSVKVSKMRKDFFASLPQFAVNFHFLSPISGLTFKNVLVAEEKFPSISICPVSVISTEDYYKISFEAKKKPAMHLAWREVWQTFL